MKPLTIFLTFLATVLFFSCAENEKPVDEWLVVEEVAVEDKLTNDLNTIFSIGNVRLWHANRADFIISQINSLEEFHDLDISENIPEINFNDHTLIWTKAVSSYDTDKLVNVMYYVNHFKQVYKVELSIEQYPNDFFSSGIFYDWRIYPKLIPHYDITMEVQTFKK